MIYSHTYGRPALLLGSQTRPVVTGASTVLLVSGRVPGANASTTPRSYRGYTSHPLLLLLLPPAPHRRSSRLINKHRSSVPYVHYGSLMWRSLYYYWSISHQIQACGEAQYTKSSPSCASGCRLRQLLGKRLEAMPAPVRWRLKPDSSQILDICVSI